PLPVEVYERREEMSHQEFMAVFTGLAQFAEVGQGNMNWPALLPAAEKAGAEYFLIEQDDTYGRDPYDSIRQSREYPRSIGGCPGGRAHWLGRGRWVRDGVEQLRRAPPERRTS